MSLMDELSKLPPNGLGGTDKSFIDADTLQDQKGNRFRIQGIDAGEIEKVIANNDEFKYKLGTEGGQATTDIIRGLANEQGFTNVVPLFGEDGKPIMDTLNKRQVVDLTNDKGESFKSKLLEAGAFDINKHTTEQDVAARDIAEARRNQAKLDGSYTPNAFDQAAADIEQAEQAEHTGTLRFKQTALNEAERAQYKQQYIQEYGEEIGTQMFNSAFSQNVQIRNYDRDINNVSNNPFSDSWEQGWTGVGEAAFGMANLIGTEAGWDGVAQWGEDGVARSQAKLGEYGTTVLDYKDIEGIETAWQYLTNNMAMSLPYMVGTVGAGAIGAVSAPAGIIAGAGVASIYAGQVWNEMEGEKNAGVAIAGGITQAALDRLGISFILPKGVGAPRQITNAAIETLMKNGYTKEGAQQALVGATRREIASFAGDVQKIAKQQIQAKAIGKDLLKRVIPAAGGEAVTEMGQEAIGYLAATQGSDKEFNWSDLNNRLISAAIAGGALGGSFSVPGAAADAAGWVDVAYRTSTETSDSASRGELYSQMEKDTHGRVASIEELAADARARWATTPGATMDERSEAFKKRQGQKNSLDIATEKISNISSLWQGATRNIFSPELQENSRSARILADMFGGNLQRIFSGSNFENSKHHRVAVYKNMVMDPKSYYGGDISRRSKNEESTLLYEALNSGLTKHGRFFAQKVPLHTRKRGQVIQLAQELQALGDRMYADQKKHNPELGYEKNYLLKYKSLDKGAVYKNQGKFTQLLQSEYGLSATEAKKLTDEIVDNPEIADIDEAFSVVKGGISPGSHKKRTLGLSEKKEFQDFMEKDLFANVAHAVKSAARYTAHRDYIGENGGVINKLLDDMQAELGGSPEAEAQVDKVASQLKDYLDAESGNYKRASSEVGKKFQRIQKNFMLATTLAGLPLATISSFVELGLTSQALRKDQIFGKKGSLESLGKEISTSVWTGMKNVGGLATAKTLGETDHETRSPARDILRDLGYYEWDVGAATTTGVTETNSWHQPVMEAFFKWNGLQGITNTTRAIRASVAGDYMMDKAQTIGEWKLSGEPRTREIQEAEEALRNLGIDVDSFVELAQKKVANLPISKAEENAFGESMREATFNFINNAVALPQSANRPLIYQDPRFALFTQFQGFMATFTANHIPRLWGDYVKRGTPAMKYNAFATMTTMIMLGFASQYLKDLIKYSFMDDEDKTLGNPYLESPEYIQRGIRASGLLGTGERVLDWAFPIYEQRSKNPADWAWNVVSGESPAISYGERIARGLGKVAEGEGQQGTAHLIRAVPGFGPFTNVAQGLSSVITQGSWNPKGE